MHRSVSCLRGSPFTPDEVPAPVLQQRCQARPHGCGVVALYPIQTAYAVIKVRIKNCKPVVWLQVSRNKRKPPRTGPKDFVVGEWRQNDSAWMRSGEIACRLYYDKAVEVVVNGNMEGRNCQCVVEEFGKCGKKRSALLYKVDNRVSSCNL